MVQKLTYRKRPLSKLRVFTCFFFLLFLSGTNSAIARRCTGSSNCRACTTCSSCKHCNSGGGSCGICGRSSINSGRSSSSSGGSSHWFLWTVGIAVGGFYLLQYFKGGYNKNK